MFYGAGIIIKKKDHIDTSAVARFDQICFAPGVLSYEKCWNERKVWLSGLLMSSEIIRIVIWIFKPFVNILKNTCFRTAYGVTNFAKSLLRIQDTAKYFICKFKVNVKETKTLCEFSKQSTSV